MTQGTLYARTARIWAYVFAVVGLAFLAAPRAVGALIETAGTVLSLSGAVDATGGPLWRVLAVSLMSVLTLLALATAAEPRNRTLFHAIILSKLVSTAGFACLGLTTAPVWWICAISDGFVALTLFVTRRIDGLDAGAAELVA